MAVAAWAALVLVAGAGCEDDRRGEAAAVAASGAGAAGAGAAGASGAAGYGAGAAADSDPSAELAAAARVATDDQSTTAYGRALSNLDRAHWLEMRDGKAIFVATWVVAGAAAATRARLGPASSVREGLGPRFNAVSCQSCHFRDGRSRPLREQANAGSPRLLRLGVLGPRGELGPDPGYGWQLQEQAIAPAVAEGTMSVRLERVDGVYPDGTGFALERPRVEVQALGHGPLAAGSLTSLRSPPSLIGLGLLEAVPEAALVARADPDDADGDGISGRPAWVVDAHAGTRALGRFGWKASQPSLLVQNAIALREDLGVTTPLYPAACRPGDACADAAIELTADDLERLTRYTRLLGPPPRRHPDEPATVRGEALFAQVGCTGCHVARLTTGAVIDLPELGGQELAPYTDLLLHDLGDGLADGRPDGGADGREWRTAPLWGLGRLGLISGEVRLLHDGRARSAEEAILWHGGEGQAARDRFAALAKDDRAALLRFLDSL